MAWLKVDDRFHSSRKVKRIPKDQRLAAIGLWTLAGSWSAAEGLNGLVPDYMIEDFGGTPELVDALMSVGLWERVDEGAQFHNWTKYNPDAESIEAARGAKSEGGQHGNHLRWHAKRRLKVAGCPWCDQSSESDTDRIPESGANPPDPTRPDPTDTDSKESESKPRRTRGTRVPRDFKITDDLRDWAARETPHVDVDKKLGEWIDFWTGVPGKNGVKRDWVATWRNGMRKQEEFALRDIARFGAPARQNTPPRAVVG